MLSSKQAEMVYVDVILGRPLRNKSKEAQEFADKIRPEIEKAKKAGAKFDIPWDYNSDNKYDW